MTTMSPVAAGHRRLIASRLGVLTLAWFGLALSSCQTRSADDPGKGRPPAPTTRPVSTALPLVEPHQRDAEARVEANLAAAVLPQKCDESLKKLTALPHVAGSRADRETVDFVAARFRTFGYRVEIREYDVLLPFPRQVSVEMQAPTAFVAGLRERPVEVDFDTRAEDVILPHAAYSPDVDLTAPVVFVNQGTREDWERLAQLGVSARGCIAIVRHGKCSYASKAWLAELAGAIGLIIYCDPADDGFAKGDVYPAGPWRPAAGGHRGSILRSFLYPGDPGTPGRPSVAGAPQATFDDMASLPEIPTVLLSADDARPIVESLDGETVPDGWQGAFPFTYHVGNRGRVRVHIRLAFDWRLQTVWNTVATWTGLLWPEEEVIIGNQRDAWVHGAVDPSSGTAVLLEAARVLADAAKDGNPPARTIKFATWDAGAFGHIGSTEWGEEFAAELSRNAVAYINVGAAVSGSEFSAAGCASLGRLVTSTLDSLPSKGGAGTWLDQTPTVGGEFRLRTLTGASDAGVFLDHLGISAVDLSSSGPYGVRHSVFDTYGWMKRLGDPGFEAHARLARFLAVFVRRLAMARMLPFDFKGYGEWIGSQADAVEAANPSLDLAEIKDLARSIADLGERIESKRDAVLSRPLDLALLADLNQRLYGAERALLLDGGLPGRAWYRHALHAPDPESSADSLTLPPLTEAIRTGERAAIQSAATRLASALRRLAIHLQGTLALVDGL